jgi:hypothetical protein
LQALGAQKEVTELRGALREVAQRLKDVQQQQHQPNVVASAGPPSKIPGLDRLLELLDMPSHVSAHEATMATNAEVAHLRQALFKAQEENIRQQAALQTRPMEGQAASTQVSLSIFNVVYLLD